MTPTLFYGSQSTFITVPDGYTCPRCESVHFLAVNQDGRTHCPGCLPTKEDPYASKHSHPQR